MPSTEDGRKWGPPGAPEPGTVEPAAARFDSSRTSTLGSGCVALRPGQAVALVRATGGPPPSRVRVGLGWEVAGQGENTYLDASCILYDGRGKDVDKVWFMSKKAARGAVRHGGDSAGDRRHGGEEFVHLALSALPDGTELVRFGPVHAEPQTGLVMCKIQRDSAATGVWTMTAIGKVHEGKTVRAMVGPAKQYL
nr:TerD family protein [Micromonospora sp. DSM 115978]